MRPNEENIVKISNPPEWFNSLCLQKLCFQLINENTSIRWSTISTYKRPGHLLFDLIIKLKKIIFPKQTLPFVRGPL